MWIISRNKSKFGFLFTSSITILLWFCKTLELLRRIRSSISPLLILIISRIPFNNGKLPLHSLDFTNKRIIPNLHIISQASKVLLLIILTYRILIVNKIIPFDSDWWKIRVMRFFEFLKLTLKHLVKLCCQYIGMLCIPLLIDCFLQSNTKTSLIDDMLHNYTNSKI